MSLDLFDAEQTINDFLHLKQLTNEQLESRQDNDSLPLYKLNLAQGTKRFSTKEINELALCSSFYELDIDSPNQDVYIPCIIFGRGFERGSFYTVVKDLQGNAVHVRLNFIPFGLEEIYNQLEQVFLIKEPFLKTIGKNQVPIIDIDSPSDVTSIFEQRHNLSSSDLHAIRHSKFYPTSSSSPSPSSPSSTSFLVSELLHLALQVKDKANKLYASKNLLAAATANWSRALDIYSLCLEYDNDNFVQLQLMLLLLNRSEGYLKLGCYHEALRDISLVYANDQIKAQHFTSSQVEKTNYRYMLANYYVGSFDVALKAAHMLTDKQVKSKWIDICSKLASKEVEETSPESCLIQDIQNLDFNKDGLGMIREYTGPVKVQYTTDQGRGLYSKTDIQPGQLILISRPIVHVAPKTEHYKPETQAINHIFNTNEPFIRVQASRLLMYKSSIDPTIKTYVDALHDGIQSNKDSGWPTSIIAESNHQTHSYVDPEHCERACIFNSFNSLDMGETVLAARCAVYGLPSMINHSCVANACYSFLQGYFILRALNKPIKANEQITISYIDESKQYSDRVSQLSKTYGIQHCECELCCEDRLDGLDTCNMRQSINEHVITALEKESKPPTLRQLLQYIKQINDTYHPTRTIKPLLTSPLNKYAQAMISDQRCQYDILAEILIQNLESFGTELDRTKLLLIQNDLYNEASSLIIHPPKLCSPAVNTMLNLSKLATQHNKPIIAKSWILSAISIDSDIIGKTYLTKKDANHNPTLVDLKQISDYSDYYQSKEKS